MLTLLIGEIHSDAHLMLKENVELKQVSNEIFLTETWPGIEAVMLRTYTTLKDKELLLLPNLKYVVSCSVGIDNLDLELLKQKGIKLIHCPGSNANSVAEHTLYLILSLLRKEKPFPELKGKTVGIVGFGYIGQEVAKKLQGFECKIIAYDVIEPDKYLLQNLNVKMVSLEEISKKSDIVTIHVPFNKYTQRMINEKFLSSLKKNAFFINTSREEVIDEEALLNHQEKFAGIGLDVYSEKLEKGLKGNVLLTPHIAAQGEDSFREMCLQPIKKFLNGITSKNFN
ncbi:hypothetical protein COY27_06560 [Candidatus Woesearchaeota archaeon CG_4_10_14_0_2_um_filter_33_13]|nr:MAG: hypothetical protein COY27_06560 [Candidatus Woesearchaeota archaeon CG_4_10_14_0_2_um_filter_33_13]